MSVANLSFWRNFFFPLIWTRRQHKWGRGERHKELAKHALLAKRLDYKVTSANVSRDQLINGLSSPQWLGRGGGSSSVRIDTHLLSTGQTDSELSRSIRSSGGAGVCSRTKHEEWVLWSGWSEHRDKNLELGWFTDHELMFNFVVCCEQLIPREFTVRHK